MGWTLTSVCGPVSHVASFGKQGFQAHAIDLARWGARQVIEYDEILGYLVGRQPLSDFIEDFGDGGLLRLCPELDEGKHALTEYGIGLADDGRLLDRRMGRDQRLFHLDRRNIGATANDDVFLARDEPDVVAFAASHQVAGMIPAVLENLRRRRRIAPVEREDVGSTDQEFTDLAMRDVGALTVH